MVMLLSERSQSLRSPTNRIDGPKTKVVCLMLVDEPLIGTGPTLKYGPSNGNLSPTGCRMVSSL